MLSSVSPQDQAISAACINSRMLEAAWKLHPRPMRAAVQGRSTALSMTAALTRHKTPGRRSIRVRHYLFGWLASDRTYLARSDNISRDGAARKAVGTIKVGSAMQRWQLLACFFGFHDFTVRPYQNWPVGRYTCRHCGKDPASRKERS